MPFSNININYFLCKKKINASKTNCEQQSKTKYIFSVWFYWFFVDRNKLIGFALNQQPMNVCDECVGIERKEKKRIDKDNSERKPYNDHHIYITFNNGDDDRLVSVLFCLFVFPFLQ